MEIPLGGLKMTMNIRTKKSPLWVVAKIIRVLTVPPIMAFFAFTAFLFAKDFYDSLGEYFIAVGFLSALPFTAYPLQPVLPPFKHQGRDGQRSLAFIMSTVGYVLAVIFALAFGAGTKVTVMLVTYLVSGVTLLLINKLFKFKASGHSCGLLGPLAALVYFIGPQLLWAGIILFALSLWSSIYLKRHTLMQFIVGGIIPVFWLIAIGAILL